MISFIDKQLDQNNFKVWLYSPGGAFLGELIVDRPVLNLELEGLISTFDFTIPENIEQALVTEDEGLTSTQLQTIVNPRLNETLDQFQVEVWYGDLTTDGFQKQRFIIIDTPNAFANDITNFSYRAYSKEYENRFIRILDWPGVLIKELVLSSVFKNPNDFNKERTITLNRTPKDQRLVRVELIKDFVTRLSGKIARANEPYAFSFPAPKRETIKVFKFVDGGTDVLLTLDTDYQIVVDEYTGLLSIEYIMGSNLAENDMVYIEYRLDAPLTLPLIRSESSQLLGEFDFYYNTSNNSIKVQIPEIHKVFLPNTVEDYDSTLPADSSVIIKTYYEPVTFSAGDEIFENITKDGLTIQQVMDSILLYGDEDNNDGKWTAFYSNAFDGELRSGFNFNNTTVLGAKNQILGSFGAVSIVDTINKYFYVYEKETPGSFVVNDVVVSSYRQPTNLSIEYGKYLKGVQQSISTEELVTVMRGLGANNINAASATPTGYNEWEDYSYYLDGVTITNLAALQNGTSSVIELNKTGRWMSKQLTEKLLLWIEARNGVEKLLYEGPLLNAIVEHNLEKIGTVLLNPSVAFANYTEENGLILIQDRIMELIGAEEEKLVPLKIEEARQKTMLSILEDPANVPHLQNWTGSFLIPGQATATEYEGIAGYRNYINAKKAVLDAQLTAVQNAIGTLERDFAFINAMLQGIYQALKKNNYTSLIRSTGLTAYNFNADDFEELKGFRREGLYENRFITKASHLYKEMQKEIESVRQPRIELNIDIVGLLQAVEARVEWNNIVLGGLANIIVPRLNIDRQIQIKSISISPDQFNTSMTFSTVKNYIGIGQKFFGRFVASANYDLTNNLGYNEGIWLQGAKDASDSINKFNFGFAVGAINPIETPTLILDGDGLATDGHTINPFDDTPVNANSDVGRMILFGFVRVNAGRIDVFDRNEQGQTVHSVVIKPTGLVQETAVSQVVMDVNGFAINKKDNGNLIPQFFVDQDGNIVFAGTISQTVYDNLNIKAITIDAPGFFIRLNADGSNPVPSAIVLTATLAEGFTTFDWQYWNGTQWVSLNNTTSSISIAHNNAIWGAETTLQVRCVTNNNQTAEAIIYKVFNGTDGTDGINGINGTNGTNGTNGLDGLPGPGVVFRGRYSPTTAYFHNASRRDIVTPANADSPYFITNNPSKNGLSTWGTPGVGSDWVSFGAQFDSVATNILLTADANIRRSLVMGDQVGNTGIIRNAGADNKANILSGAQTGFFLDGADGSLTANSCNFLSGNIGGATFGSTTINNQGALEVSRVKATSLLQTGSLIVSGDSVQRTIIPASDNLYDLGFADPQTDLYWRRILLRNNPIVVSDENKKENIAPVGNEYNNIILNTEIITYNNPGEDALKIGIGARQFHQQFGEQAEAVLPMVRDGIYSADYVAFVPMMIKTIQAQEKRIQALEEQLNNG